MKKLLLFAGTSEGRKLAELLGGHDCAVTACVATEYGEMLMEDMPENVEVHTGRMDEAEIERMMHSGNYALTADATHPYAAEASRNIRTAAEKTGIPLLRIVRPEAELGGECRKFTSAAEAAGYLAETEGNILLTTGAKELDRFTKIENFAERIYPRVLPGLESIGRCLSLGYAQKRIIAMQGPFSEELNAAIIRQFDIRYLVTKESGSAGGFEEKARAARLCACELDVILRPEHETGLSAGEACRRILDILEI